MITRDSVGLSCVKSAVISELADVKVSFTPCCVCAHVGLSHSMTGWAPREILVL